MIIAEGVGCNGVGVYEKAERGLQNVDHMSKVVVRYKAVVCGTTGNDELGELV